MGDEAGMSPDRVAETAADWVALLLLDSQQGALQRP